MSSYGISNSGFNRKRLDQLLEELNSEVKSIFGDNFNVSPESPDGQINGVISESNANLWELVEAAYNAFSPSAATGVALSNLVQLNGITRLPATSSLVELSITGVPDTVIPSGSLISTNDSVSNQFATTQTAVINEAGVTTVIAASVIHGPVLAAAGTLTEIDTPITGWSSVTNDIAAIPGTDEESDTELRARRERSVARDAQSVIDAIFAAVSNIAGVTQVSVFENDTDVTNGIGQPPHSFWVIALGGSDEDIGEAIWLKKPAGITTFGNTAVVVLDSQTVPHTLYFSRPTPVPIYVTVNLLTDDSYPADGDDQIKTAIVEYANGDLIANRGFGLGDDVIHSRLYTPINTVQGHEIVELFIGKSPNPTSTDNIVIDVSETSEFLVANIEVNT